MKIAYLYLTLRHIAIVTSSSSASRQERGQIAAIVAITNASVPSKTFVVHALGFMVVRVVTHHSRLKLAFNNAYNTVFLIASELGI